MGRVTTDKTIRAGQLGRELGAGVVVRQGPVTAEVEAPGVDDSTLLAAITAHSPVSLLQERIDALDGARDVVRVSGTTVLDGDLDVKRAVIEGDAPPGRGGGGGATLQFTSGGVYSSVEDNFGFELRHLRVVGSAKGSGQTLVDFTGQNYPRLTDVRIELGGVGLLLANGDGVECHYGHFDRVDVNQCTTGVQVGDVANSHGFFGGRIWDCGVGALLGAANDLHFYKTAFEASDTFGIDSTASNVSLVGCRMENASAVNLKVRSGAGRHEHVGVHWSSGTDVVDDNTTTVVFGLDSSARRGSGGYADQNRRTSGNIVLNSTSLVDIDNGLDLTLNAETGDVIEVSVNGWWAAEAVYGILDVATVVAGAPVNYVSNGTGTSATNGVPGWVGPPSGIDTFGGSVQYTVQAGDISGGTVTLRLRGRTSAASNKTLSAVGVTPLTFSARNHG